MTRTVLLSELRTLTHSLISRVQSFNELSEEALNFKPDHTSWSILECLEHLNRYGDFYLPEIKNRLDSADASSVELVESGAFGKYFANSLRPKENMNKIKTFKSMNPRGSKLDKAVIRTFLEQQDKMLELLKKAENYNLGRIKTAISISKWIKLKLGDTLKVVIYHNERHVLQAEKVLKVYTN